MGDPSWVDISGLPSGVDRVSAGSLLQHFRNADLQLQLVAELAQARAGGGGGATLEQEEESDDDEDLAGLPNSRAGLANEILPHGEPNFSRGHTTLTKGNAEAFAAITVPGPQRVGPRRKWGPSVCKGTGKSGKPFFQVRIRSIATAGGKTVLYVSPYYHGHETAKKAADTQTRSLRDQGHRKPGQGGNRETTPWQPSDFNYPTEDDRALLAVGRNCHFAPPPSPFSRRFNRDDEGVPAK